MRVAVPLFGSRVSPRCLIAREMLLAEVRGGRVDTSVTIPLKAEDDDDFVDRLLELGVDLLVCGGIRRELASELAANRVAVIHNVAGEIMEVLDALRRGRLATGHGLSAPGEAPVETVLEPAAPDRIPGGIDCVACAERTCLEGMPCRLAGDGLPSLPLPAGEARIAEVGRDVAAESDPKLCRIAELTHFALGMGYRRVGVAFCWELFRETDILVPVLARFFDVVPVCCRVGTTPEPDPSRLEPVRCNPALQAWILERAGTELNVLVGPCMGCDLIFSAHSHAPVTTLFVKDRTLAHNPVGAIYTQYHLDALREGRAPAGPAPAAG
jgi:uncharacterized metal-binding protein